MDSKIIEESSFQIQKEIKNLQDRLLFKRNKLNEKEQEISSLHCEIEELKVQINEFYDFNSSAFFTIDENFLIHAVNFQGALLLEYDRNQLINKNFLNFVNHLQEDTLKKCIKDLIRNNVKQVCELELLQKGGKRKYINIECFFTKDKLILLLLRDITYIRQLESQQTQLNQSIETITNLLKNVSDAIATLDNEFYFKIITPSFTEYFSKIFAIEIERGMNFFTLISTFSEYKQQFIHACQQALLGIGTCILIENTGETPETNFCIELNFNPIHNHFSQKTEIILLIKDLTDIFLQKKLKMKEQAKLVDSIRLNTMEGMASALAHEMNQPLTAIFLYSQMCLLKIKKLVEENKLNANLLSLMNKIITQAKHASEVMKRLKSFIYQDVYLLELADLNSLIKDTMIFLDYELSNSKLKINLQLDENLPQVHIDKIQIMQIIINLTRNSMEAMQELKNHTPELTIQTKNEEKHIEVHFRDNGKGIIPEHVEKIFNSFFTTKNQGNGLGLNICKNLIEAHQGKLSLKAHNGKGAWFVFTLPK
ncbi:ATP-binding protein [Legionella sp. PC997]|uniref:PAS domain-containing sensor histidine kinase n=1 Tax=Legionella sp. PC997 TaxID=2755562 RepID=UPI0015FBD0F0|nr:ATP-binding protein [Legionella sp. PC997]QMT59450.1 PAS domain-containing sensor histidine kinase [Legionella sp. PC997]